mgnify:CR=1 FL=1
MAYKIDGTEVISDGTGASGSTYAGDITNLGNISSSGFTQKAFGAGTGAAWTSSSSFYHSGSGTARVFDLRYEDCWPTTNDFREAMFAISCYSIQSGTNRTFSSNVTFRHGTGPENILCASTQRVALGHKLYIHVVNTKGRFTNLPAYIAKAWTSADQSVGSGQYGQILSTSGIYQSDMNWGSPYTSGDGNYFKITYPTFNASFVSWSHTCHWR